MNTVEFPGLGISFNINRVAFEIFEVPIYWYGIIIAAGFLLAVILGMSHSKKFGIDPDNIIDMVLFATPAAIIGARLFYVIFSWDMFKDNLLDVFNTRKGGLAIYGGVIFAFITAYLFARVKKINFLKLFDFGSPYLIMAQGIGRWGNFFNQEAFGTNTSLPWGMTSESVKDYLSLLQSKGAGYNPDLPVHPTFLYESLWDIAVFFFLIWYRKKKKLDGEVFSLYLILYGTVRFFIEGIRTDSLMLGNLRISQLLSAIFVLVMSLLFILRRRKMAVTPDSAEAAVESEYSDILRTMREETDTVQQDSLQNNSAEEAGEAPERTEESREEGEE